MFTRPSNVNTDQTLLCNMFVMSDMAMYVYIAS